MAKKDRLAGFRHVNRHYEPRHFATLAGWERYADWLRRHARVATAMLPEPPRTPMRPRIWGAIESDGVVCEKVAFESMPGFLSTGNLYRPAKRRSGKAPGILCPHGHWPHGRLHDDHYLGSVIARCYNLALMGATVFSWDMVGINDSCQAPHGEFKGDEHWGLSLMGLQTLNSVRALDFLLSLPGVDPKRIGVTGASGGGTQSFTLMAVDGDRLAAAAPICMISYTMQGGCLCENAPLLRIDATSVDLARTFAPKPVFMGSCTGDWTKNTPREELPAVREIYRLYGKGVDKRIGHLHLDAPHNYNFEMRMQVYGFFNKWLFGARSDEPVHEPWFSFPQMRRRMLWYGRKAPAAISAAELKRMWVAFRESALRPHLASAESARRGLGPLLGHALGVTLTSPSEFRRRRPEGIVARREGDSLVVAPGGRPRDRSKEVQHFTAYNRTALADRVHEVLAAVEDSGGGLRLVGRGEAGFWCLLAGALSARIGSLDVDLSGFDPDSDESWRRHLDTPAIRQVGGMATVFAMLGARPLALRGAGAGLRRLAARYART